MPQKPTLVSQLIVMQTIEYAGEIRAWADRVPSLTLSSLLRDVLEYGRPTILRRLELEHGPLTPAQLYAGKLASVPKTDRDAWARANPAPRARARAA